jgi:hypothetical protein
MRRSILTCALILDAAVLLLGTCASLAAVRGDVMAGAYRCAVVADSRQWLDCIYGAAQQVRARLALTPATTAQIRLASSPPAGGEVKDQALRDQALAQAASCSRLPTEREWLDCYYKSTQVVRASLNLPPVAGPTAIDHSADNVMRSADQASNRFGLPDAPAAGLQNRISARMASYTFDQFGMFTVELSNGQVWQQLKGDTSNAHWRKSAAGYFVSISRGAFGSYNLRVALETSVFKVKRIK